jgi:hypothetical protein
MFLYWRLSTITGYQTGIRNMDLEIIIIHLIAI